jgi:hypothetical protein
VGITAETGELEPGASQQVAAVERRDRGPRPIGAADSREQAPSLGIVFDAGLPDGAMGSLAYRPWYWLRACAGGGTNSISPGVRVGLAVLPLGVGPSLSVEGGWYFEGDANDVARQMVGRDYQDNRMAERFGYQFVNLRLGLESGGKYVSFFVHAGMSYLRAELHEADSVLGGEPTTASGPTQLSFNVPTDPIVTAFIPSAKLGFIVYLV